MARIFVTRADPDAPIRVEVYADLHGMHVAECSECNANVVAGTHEQWNFEDTVQSAEIHVDMKHTD